MAQHNFPALHCVAVLGLRLLVASLLPRNPGFNARSVRLWYVMHKGVPEEAFLWVLSSGFCIWDHSTKDPYSFIHLSLVLYNLSKLLNDTPHRTAVRTADLAAVSLSGALLHWVSYHFIKRGIADVGVGLTEFFIFSKLTASIKEKLVVEWGMLHVELTLCYTMVYPVWVWFV